MTRREMIEAAIADNPDLAKNKAALSRHLHKEHPETFTTTEVARDSVRYYAGQHGDKNRRSQAQNHIDPDNTPNILILDIETAPLKVYAWGKWKQNIQDGQIIADWFCLSWAAKWYAEDKTHGDVVTPDEAIERDDKRIMETLWELVDAADMVIAHNAVKFDVPRLQTRMFLNGLPPFSPIKLVDTLAVMRREFSLSSNRLDYVNKMLGIEGKIDTGGFELWEGCMNGDEDALNKMLVYNVHDVVILEKTYERLRPWIKSHPNWGAYTDNDDPCCHACGCTDLEYIGDKYTNVSKFPMFKCNECGQFSRGRFNTIPLNKRKKMLTRV